MKERVNDKVVDEWINKLMDEQMNGTIGRPNNQFDEWKNEQNGISIKQLNEWMNKW